MIIGDATSHFATDNSLHCRRLRGTKESVGGKAGCRKSTRTRMQIVRWALPVPTSTTTTTHEGAPVCQRARTNDGSRLVGEHRRAPHWPSAPPLSPSTPLQNNLGETFPPFFDGNLCRETSPQQLATTILNPPSSFIKLMKTLLFSPCPSSHELFKEKVSTTLPS